MFLKLLITKPLYNKSQSKSNLMAKILDSKMLNMLENNKCNSKPIFNNITNQTNNKDFNLILTSNNPNFNKTN